MCGARTMSRRQRHYSLWLKSIPLPDKAPQKKSRAVRSSATCYPADKFKELVGSGWKDRLPCGRCNLHRGRPNFQPQDAKAVVDGNVITSQGPGTSLHGTLEKVEQII